MGHLACILCIVKQAQVPSSHERNATVFIATDDKTTHPGNLFTPDAVLNRTTIVPKDFLVTATLKISNE